MSYYKGDYYQGDYYRGDYYRGDPGIFGTIAKTAIKLGAGLIPGGSLIQTGISALGAIKLPKIPRQLQFPGFGQPSPVTGPAFGPERPGRKVCMRRVYSRANPQGAVQVVKCPRMNPGNARALRRAIRREKSFIGLARRALRGTGITVGRRPAFARKKIGRR